MKNDKIAEVVCQVNLDRSRLFRVPVSVELEGIAIRANKSVLVKLEVRAAPFVNWHESGRTFCKAKFFMGTSMTVYIAEFFKVLTFFIVAPFEVMELELAYGRVKLFSLIAKTIPFCRYIKALPRAKSKIRMTNKYKTNKYCHRCC